ncbi:capsule assembly Wzi family protein [Mangrovibacterium lignilyticum]|uniref:capsule assembly Wzi family protein n=1 Tax=Mangrovibacterium lignilyticum TaxID=2668052 RepID=UPI0013CFC1C1|nr:capsule assembly Wzi family protein [Mangrovibacterium lignilyticum]
MKRTTALVCILVSTIFTVFSQNSTVTVESVALARKGNQMPFWFTHNQLGKFKQQVGYQLLSDVNFTGTYSIGQDLNLVTGTELTAGYDVTGPRIQIIQAYLGLSNEWMKFTVGSRANELLFEGLSSSNGDIVESVNYRPVPKISLGTNRFQRLPILKKLLKDRLSFKFIYEEGYLYDDRYIEHAMLHHDHIYFRYQIKTDFRVTAGINRYAFWGGTNRDGTKLPSDFESYLRTILCKSGDQKFGIGEQMNIAGNILGAYIISFEKSFANLEVEFRISHPFEDRSGLEMENWRDNLMTLFLKRKETGKLVDALLLEFMYTKHQSGRVHNVTGPKEERMRGRDNYFNHYIYRSGYTFNGFSMGTPLFAPLENPTAHRYGFANNRVCAWHMGAKGYLSYPRLSWKALLTYTRNFGTYDRPYLNRHDQWYSLGEISWNMSEQNFVISGQAGVDYGDLSGNVLGLGMSLKKTF